MCVLNFSKKLIRSRKKRFKSSCRQMTTLGLEVKYFGILYQSYDMNRLWLKHLPLLFDRCITLFWSSPSNISAVLYSVWSVFQLQTVLRGIPCSYTTVVYNFFPNIIGLIQSGKSKFCFLSYLFYIHNLYISEVDQSVGLWLVGKYATAIRGKKRYSSLFTPVLDISAVNSWIL